MSGAKEIAGNAVDNIEVLLSDMFEGNYADNEISLGVLLSSSEEIQVQLKITRVPSQFIETEYSCLEGSVKRIGEVSANE